MRARVPGFLIVLACVKLLFPDQAVAQFFQQGGKLVGTGASGSPEQGVAVALSADGNTAIVGGANDSGNAGAAWIWTRAASVWTQQIRLVGSGAVGTARQGSSVAISADGNTAIIGGPGDNASIGAVWVWTRSGAVWTQQGSKLVGLTATVNGGNQGFCVALSADGNTALVGGPGENPSGAAWVWTRSGGVWSQQGNKLVGTGVVLIADQGSSVSLSADGNTAIIGAQLDNQSTGAVWVWTRSGSTWTQQGNKLVGSGAAGPAHEGFSVSLSADGNTALVGGRDDNSDVGAAWVWTRSGVIWTQQGSKLIGPSAIGDSLQGDSVSLAADGNMAVIGGPGDTSNAGAAWIWTRSGDIWSPQPAKLTGSGAAGSSQQGSSVALSADGKTAIVGGPFDNSRAGAVWIFASQTPLRRRAAKP
jgi:hypothetical protein